MKGNNVEMGWLDCTISPGQFSGEFAVRGELFNDAGFSLFVEEEYVRFRDEPVVDKPVQGFVRITTLQKEDDLCLVALPQSTMENGCSVTVKSDKVKDSV